MQACAPSRRRATPSLRRSATSAAAAATALVAVLAVASAPRAAHAEVVTGDARGAKWSFLGKFCFDYSPEDLIVGSATVAVTTTQETLTLYMYDDEAAQWPAVYDNGLSCVDKIAPEHLPEHGTHQIVPDAAHSWNITVEFREHLRPRFWYLAVASEGCVDDVDITAYQVTFLNGESQFSVDQMGVVDMYATSFCVALVMVLGMVATVRQLDTTPAVLRFFVWSLLMHTAASMCYLVHWASFGANGKGEPLMEGTGAVAEVLSIVMMWIMATLMALGYGVSSFALTGKRNWVGLALVGVLIVAYIVLTIWYEVGHDPASTNYVYDSVPGFIIVLLNVAFFGWWAFRLRATWFVEYDSTKRQMYMRFAVAVGAYFFITPVAVLVGALVRPWEQARVVQAVLLVFRVLVHGALVFMFWPERSKKFFKVRNANAGLSVGLGDDEGDDFSAYASL